MSPFNLVQNMSQQEVPSTDVPLFKITFRDISTARKYRKRVESIFDYFTTDSPVHESELNQVIHDRMDTDENLSLELDIFEKKAVQENSSKNSLGKPKKSRKRKCKKKNTQNLAIFKKNKTHDDQTYKVINDDSTSAVTNPASSHTNHEQANLFKQVNNWVEIDLEAENATVQSDQLTSQLDRRIENENSNNFHSENTFFDNSSVELGSYGFFNQDQKIILSKNGLTFLVPIEKDAKVQVKSINVELNEIMKVFVNFSLSKPVLIFFINHNKADKIKNIISTDDSNETCYDSTLFQKITILPSCINFQSKCNIKKLFELNRLLSEIEPMRMENVLEEDNASKKDEPSKVQKRASTQVEHTFICKVVRVGSYEYAKKFRHFTISGNNIKFSMPHSKGTSIKTITISMIEIKKISVRFSDTEPIIFCSITNQAIKMISDSLGIDDHEKLFNNSSENQIIIYPQKLSKGHPIFIELTKLEKLEILSKEALDLIIDKLFESSIKKGKMKSDILNTSKTVLDDNESINNSYDTEIHFLADGFSIGDREYNESSVVEIILTEKGYNINLPMYENNGVNFINIPFHFENLYGHKLQIHGNTVVIYFRLKKKFVKENIKCLRPYGIHLKKKSTDKTDSSTGRRVIFVIKVEDSKLMLLLDLLHKNGSKFITKECATELVDKSL